MEPIIRSFFEYQCSSSLMKLEATLLNAKLQKNSDVDMISTILLQLIPLYRTCESQVLSETETDIETEIAQLTGKLQNFIIKLLGDDDLSFDDVFDLFFDDTNQFILSKTNQQ